MSTEMSVYKLKSSDGVIFTVDAATVKQMVTIQTMIDHEDEDSDEVIPVPTVNAQVLEKIIHWIENYKIDHEKTEKIAWYIQYFNVGLNDKFEIISAADYLEVKSLLNESCRNVLINYKWEDVNDAASNFHDPQIVALLEKHEREHGDGVVVTIVDSNLSNLKYFDTKTETWTLLSEIPDEHSSGGCKLCCVEDKIYLVGGYNDKVTEYNPYTNTWRKMPCLLEGRTSPSVCTLDNKIFVMGGGGYTCEMLDLNDDDPEWRYIAEMNRILHNDNSAVVIEKNVYVVGGEGSTNSVEVYDADKDQWNIVTNMPTKRCWAGVAALGNKIYVTGGHYGVGGYGPYMSRVDCYDTNTNTWSQVANMNTARSDHSMASLHGRLYAIGGRNDNDNGYVDSVEVYDPDNDSWTLLQHKLDGEVYYTAACLINKYHVE